MRTTRTIDDDVLAAAKGLAARQNKTVGEVISALSRQALLPESASAKVRKSSGQVTDSYLLALACAHGARLASFDRRLVVGAVRGGKQGLHLIA